MKVHTEVVDPRTVIGIRDRVDDPGPLFESGLPRLFRYCGENTIEVTGPPLGIYYEVGDGTFDMAVAIPIGEPPSSVDPAMFVGETPDGLAAVATYVGPYDGLPDAWQRFVDEINGQGLTMRDEACLEEYELGPDATDDPTKWRTRFVQPIADGG